MSVTSLSIRALRELLGRREISALEVARAHLDRLEALDASTIKSLLTIARDGPVDELQRAQIDLVRAQMAFASSRRSTSPSGSDATSSSSTSSTRS